MPKAHYFLLSLSVYSALTEIKMFPSINLVFSLHVCKHWCKHLLVWEPLARLHGLKQKYFQHCNVTNRLAPPYQKLTDTTVSYRTEPWILWTGTPLIYAVYIYIYYYFYLFQDSLINRMFKRTTFIWNSIICNIINVFTITFKQF